MKLPLPELKKIQIEWEKKLEAEGLKNTDLPSFISKGTLDNYYELIEDRLRDPDTCFKNEIHRYILTRYAAGALARDIVKELQSMGTPRNRHSIRFIVRRYEAKWNIRMYSLKQLNIKLLNKAPIQLSPIEPQRSRRGICR